MSLGEGFIKVRPDTKNFANEAKSGVLGPIKGLAKAAAGAFAAVKVASFFSDSVSAASDLNESLTKSQQVFKGSAKSVEQFADSAATSLGESKQQALEASATFGNLFRSMGTGPKQAANLSTHLVKLAGDLASFNNVSPEEALEALRSGVVGEVEPLRKFGVNLSQTAIQAKALATGIVKPTKNLADIKIAAQKAELAQSAYTKAVAKHGRTSDEAKRASLALEVSQKALTKATTGSVPPLTAAQKAQAAYKLIMEQTKLAQGDFGRTSGGLANQQRILSAQFTDLKAKIGAQLLPVVVQIVGWTNKFLTAAMNLGKNKDFQRYVAEARDIAQQLITKVQNLWTSLQKLANSPQVKAFLAFISNTALPAVRRAIDDAIKSFDRIAPIVEGDVRKVVQLVQRFVSQIRQNWGTLTQIFGPIVKAALAIVTSSIKSTIAIFEGIIRGFHDVLHGEWGKAWGELKGIVSTALGQIVTNVKAILGALATTVFNLAKLAGAQIVKGVKAGVAALPGVGLTLAKLLGQAVAAAARGAFNLGKHVGELIIQGILQGISNLAGSLTSKAESVAKSVASKLNPVGWLSAFVQTGGNLIGAVESQTKALGKGLTAALISAITSATTAAKQNLTSLTGTLSSDIGSVIDAATTKQVNQIARNLAGTIAGIPNQLSAAVAGVAAGTSTSAAAAKIAKDQADRQLRNLQESLASANAAAAAGPGSTGSTQAQLDQAAKDAAVDLDDYLLQVQIDADNAAYDAKVKAAQDQADLDTQSAQNSATVAKQSVDDQIALWTQQFNAGKLSQNEYFADITGIVTAYGAPGGSLNDAYGNMGDLLGAAWETSFATHLGNIQEQIREIANAGPGGTGGSGLDSSITNPGDAIGSQFVDATGTVAGDADSVKKARTALAAAAAKDKSANKSTIGPWGIVFPPDPKAKAAADAALKAAQAQLDAAEAAQKRDTAMLAALRLLLVKAGEDPNAVLAAAAR